MRSRSDWQFRMRDLISNLEIMKCTKTEGNRISVERGNSNDLLLLLSEVGRTPRVVVASCEQEGRGGWEVVAARCADDALVPGHEATLSPGVSLPGSLPGSYPGAMVAPALGWCPCPWWPGLVAGAGAARPPCPVARPGPGAGAGARPVAGAGGRGWWPGLVPGPVVATSRGLIRAPYLCAQGCPAMALVAM